MSRKKSAKAMKSPGEAANYIGEIDRILEVDQILEFEIQEGESVKPKSDRRAERAGRFKNRSLDIAKAVMTKV